MPSYKDKYADAIQEQFYKLEDRINADIIRRIKKTGEITSTADWQINKLIELGYSSAEIEDAIKDALNASYPDMFNLYDTVLDNEYVRYKKVYEQINAKYIPFEDNKTLQQYLEAAKKQTKDSLVNLTQSLGIVEQIGGQYTFFPLTQFYQKTLDAAVLDITSGVFDYNTVLNRTVNTLSRSGVRTVDYTSGWSNRVAVAARRAVLTGASQLTAKINEYNAEQLGTNYFEIDRHDGARPTHRPWQGKVWSKEELVSVCGLGTVTGLNGANCYHIYYPFIPGISERNYTDEELKRLDALEDQKRPFKDKEYNAYEARQKQRQMETAMRAQRAKIKALERGKADKMDVIVAKAKYQGQLYEYQEFSNAMKVKPQMNRVYIDGLGRVAPGRALGHNPIAKYDRLYYNKDGSLLVTDDWTGRKHVSVPKQFKPYAVIETMKWSTGQRDLTIYDESGWKLRELHSGNHNMPLAHPYGENGEHSHLYGWNRAANKEWFRSTGELTTKERKWIGDRIWLRQPKI